MIKHITTPPHPDPVKGRRPTGLYALLPKGEKELVHQLSTLPKHRGVAFMTITTLTLLIALFFLHSCKKNNEPVTTITAGPVELHSKEERLIQRTEIRNDQQNGGKIYRIDIKGAGDSVEQTVTMPQDMKPAYKLTIPPDTYEETSLSDRLREKMLEAYAGKESSMPDVKIYLSNMNYDEFIQYYKNLGYKMHTVAVPATDVIDPVLTQKPELAKKINRASYENVVIHQVLIDEAGISAADKYIDPDTFQVIDKTFVTKMNK